MRLKIIHLFFPVVFAFTTQTLSKQLLTIIDQRMEKPKTILMIATHFGLAINWQKLSKI